MPKGFCFGLAMNSEPSAVLVDQRAGGADRADLRGLGAALVGPGEGGLAFEVRFRAHPQADRLGGVDRHPFGQGDFGALLLGAGGELGVFEPFGGEGEADVEPGAALRLGGGRRDRHLRFEVEQFTAAVGRQGDARLGFQARQRVGDGGDVQRLRHPAAHRVQHVGGGDEAGGAFAGGGFRHAAVDRLIGGDPLGVVAFVGGGAPEDRVGREQRDDRARALDLGGGGVAAIGAQLGVDQDREEVGDEAEAGRLSVVGLHVEDRLDERRQQFAVLVEQHFGDADLRGLRAAAFVGGVVEVAGGELGGGALGHRTRVGKQARGQVEEEVAGGRGQLAFAVFLQGEEGIEIGMASGLVGRGRGAQRFDPVFAGVGGRGSGESEGCKQGGEGAGEQLHRRAPRLWWPRR